MRQTIEQSIGEEEKLGNRNVSRLEGNSLVPGLLCLTDELYLVWDVQH